MSKTRKRAGIITFHEAANYGAVLQAYALCQALKPYCDAAIYPHRNQHIHDLYNPNPLKAKSFKYRLGKLVNFPVNLAKRRAFDQFIQKHLPLGGRDEAYDLMITGSDQVWNHQASGFDKAYFLDFVQDARRKNAYAASFGFEHLPDEHHQAYRELLADFHAISVREESGKRIIQDLTGRQVPVVLDPTLLLDQHAWRKAFPGKPGGEPYVLVYAFHLTSGLCQAINLACKHLNAKAIVLMPQKSKSPKRNSLLDCAVYLPAESPESWINYFANAAYIITNSFHGLSFALNFNKPFILQTLRPPAKVNTRLLHILDLVGLSERILDDNPQALLDTPVDFDHANRVLDRERQASLAFLESMVMKAP